MCVPSASNIGAKTRQIPSSPITYWGRSDGLAQFGIGNSTTLIPAFGTDLSSGVRRLSASDVCMMPSSTERIEPALTELLPPSSQAALCSRAAFVRRTIQVRGGYICICTERAAQRAAKSFEDRFFSAVQRVGGSGKCFAEPLAFELH